MERLLGNVSESHPVLESFLVSWVFYVLGALALTYLTVVRYDSSIGVDCSCCADKRPE